MDPSQGFSEGVLSVGEPSVDGEALAVSLVEAGVSSLGNLVEASLQVLLGFGLLLVVDLLEEGVVLVVSVQLDWVLVVGEQAVVAVGQISEGTALN